MLPDGKICTKCRQLKPIIDFYIRKDSVMGHMSHCKLCMNARAKKYRDEDNERTKDQHLRCVFGISLKEYKFLLDFQAGLCAICCEPMQPGRNTHLDHNHKTGKVRGLLCNKCNLGIGGANDDPHILIDASKYLLEHRN